MEASRFISGVSISSVSSDLETLRALPVILDFGMTISGLVAETSVGAVLTPLPVAATSVEAVLGPLRLD